MRSLFLLTAGLALAAGPAQAERFEIGGDSRIVFVSSAPLESFEGKTGGVTGTVDLGEGTFELNVTVDMATFDTGIGLRDRHMRENHLHTDEFPEATFHAAKVTDGTVPAAGTGTHALTVEGDMTLHGVTRTVQVPVELAFGEGGTLRVRSEFEISLPDYEIPRPKFLVMKLNEVQQIRVDLAASPAAAAPAVNEKATETE